MGTRQKATVTQFIEILADGLGRNLEPYCQVFDEYGAGLPRKGEDLMLARAEERHGVFPL